MFSCGMILPKAGHSQREDPLNKACSSDSQQSNCDVDCVQEQGEVGIVGDGNLLDDTASLQ